MRYSGGPEASVSVLDWSLKDSEYAVVSIKTTGLTQNYDRICEISVVTAVPGQPLRLALDTLIHPGRRLAGAEVHGIRDRNVAMAPTFEQVALDLLRELQERILVGHNMEFVLRFLQSEYKALGVDLDVPYLDTMSIASMLSRQPNRPLLEACDVWELEASLECTSAAAALDTAKLMRVLMAKLDTMGLHTFGRLTGKGNRAYQQSLSKKPMPRGFSYDLEDSAVRWSRHDRGVEGRVNVALALYWDALLVALDDLIITDEEQQHLERLKTDLELEVDDVYLLHSRMFTSSIVAMIERNTCTEDDRKHLQSLRSCLTRLGWAPGD